MNTFEIAILSMALIFDSWIVYQGAGSALAEEPVSRKLYFAATMFMMQALLAGTGIWIGFKMGGLYVQNNILISFSIILIFGLKVLFTGIRTQAEEKTFDYTDNSVILLAAIAEGITSLGIGIAIGLLSLKPFLHWGIITGFLLVGIFSGLKVGSQPASGLNKFRPGPIGGLLLLATAIKLALGLASF